MSSTYNAKRVAILVDDYFEQAEFEEPLNALQDAGHRVTIVAASNLTVHGMNHAEMGDMFHADILLENAKSDDYDALVLPGGALNADNLRVSGTAQQWVTSFLDSQRPLAIICHAPWVLVSADAVEGLRLTGYHTIRDDVVNAGGEWVDIPVVLEKNLISSRQPSDLPAFIEAILHALQQPASPYPNSPQAATIPNPEARQNTDRAPASARSQTQHTNRRYDQEESASEQDILASGGTEDIIARRLSPSGILPGDERTDIL